MEEVLKKVAKLSVTGGNAMIRIHCRQVFVRQETSFCFTRQVLSSSRGFADLSEILAGLPAGEEAEKPPGLRGVAAALRARSRQGVGAGDAGLHLPGVPTGEGTPHAGTKIMIYKKKPTSHTGVFLRLSCAEPAAAAQRPLLRPPGPGGDQRRLGAV